MIKVGGRAPGCLVFIIAFIESVEYIKCRLDTRQNSSGDEDYISYILHAFPSLQLVNNIISFIVYVVNSYREYI